MLILILILFLSFGQVVFQRNGYVCKVVLRSDPFNLKTYRWIGFS